MKIIIIIAFLCALVVLLIQGQHKMIYHPRPYSPHEPIPEICMTVEYSTSQGRQVSYYIPPGKDKSKSPERLWVMFGGNASLALDWMEFISDFPDPGAGFLLLEYPGYGRCSGKAGPETILESSSAALSTLAGDINVDEEDLVNRLNIIGHSLGSAAALLFGCQYSASRIVLVSPFTSLRDMAVLVVGKPLNRTLFHNYDNRARINEIMTRLEPPEITIVHGDHDKVVPVWMGRELAEMNSAISYFEEKNGDHNYILVTARNSITGAMITGLGYQAGKPIQYFGEK